MDKELMNCILSEDEINEAWKSNIFVSGPYKDIVSHVSNVLEAQLQSSKLKAYIDGKVQAEREKAKEIISSLLPISCGTCVYCNRGEPKNKDNIHLILNGEDVMCLEHEFYEEAREYLEGGD